MIKNKVCVLFILLLLSNLCFAGGSNNAVETIKKKVHHCISNNLHKITRLRDCSTAAEQAFAEYTPSNELNWSFAELVRRELGNQISLKYFKRALQNNITAENCVHDGMDFAVKVGLDLPYNSFKPDADIATDIVFKYCWSEFKEEIIALSERNPSNYWSENVCGGAHLYHKKSAYLACSEKQ